MSHSCDVLIIGGGIAGLSLASMLSAETKVVLAEAEPTLAYHTSSRSARQLVPSHGPAAVRELTARTLEILPALECQSGLRCLAPASFLLVGDEESVRAHANELMESLSHAQAGEISPELKPESFSAARLDRHSFTLDADALIEFHRATAAANGAVILTGAPVRSARKNFGGWRVDAGTETIEAATVVNAAGAWADPVAGIFGAAPHGLVPYRRTAALVEVERPLAPGHPMVVMADGSFYYRPEGSQVLISPSETVASPAEDAKPHPGDIEAVIALIDAATTMRIRSVARSWTGLRTEPADGHPVVGFDGVVEGFFWLAGQDGYGFQTSSGIAELAAALLLRRGPAAWSASAAAALSPLRNPA
ncbi:FAD-binding oxidoreductase [Arthrobacter sp. I2-34]|uniref:FAD-binding oxidoreductase n=1 Tax=Arthrobacter hankyongi TaxID=2904801 RepID=A0ABS9L188_9MICC|nr:FAD-dependent oxidoreductase [Arthrobacter hankyongi]MCG2620449.1 FAD-binding oxidoreductase [Arthrobacter hankyongi]